MYGRALSSSPEKKSEKSADVDCLSTSFLCP